MGFSKELFLNHVDDEFTCSICLNVLEDPVQDNEEHTFCRGCITEWLSMPNRTCPISRNYLHGDHLKRPFRVFLNLLSKLEMKCPNESKGCNDVFILENYFVHLKVCKHDASRYFNCGTCGLSVPIKLLDKEHNCLESMRTELTENQKSLEEKNQKILSLEISLSRAENLTKIFQKKFDQQSTETSHLKERLAQTEHRLSSMAASAAKLKDHHHHDQKELPGGVLDSSFKKKSSKLPRLFSNAGSRHTTTMTVSSAMSRSALFASEARRKKWNPSTLVDE